MGQKDWTRAICDLIPKNFFAVLGIVFFLSNSAQAIPFRYEFVPDPNPLTSSEILRLDSHQLNPHRKRWALERKAEITNLRGKKLKAGLWVPVLDGISVSVVFKKRKPGKIYFDLEQMPCGKLGPVFSTYEGVDEAGSTAAQYWFNLLKQAQTSLEFKLRKIKTTREKDVIDKAQLTFEEWLKDVDDEWLENRNDVGRTAERKYYLSKAKELSLCKNGKRNKSALSWSDALEDPPSKESTSNQANVVANIPARRWAGSYSVRVSLKFGSQSAMAQFLIDPLTGTSSISESWLRKNGFVAEVDFARTKKPQSVFWRGVWKKARPVFPAQMELSDLSLPIQRLWLRDAELFFPPNFVTSCCDGILGQDFLRHFTIEFQPYVPHPVKPMSRIKIWKSDFFKPEDSFVWMETILDSKKITSVCPSKRRLNRMNWETFSEKNFRAIDWKCLNSTIKKFPVKKINSKTFMSSIDQIERGFIFDLPNGRVWVRSNESRGLDTRNGLDVEYVLSRRERLLRIKSVSKILQKKGLQRLSVIGAINSIPAEDLDEWEAQRILNGRYGSSVTVKFRHHNSSQWQTVQIDLTDAN